MPLRLTRILIERRIGISRHLAASPRHVPRAPLHGPVVDELRKHGEPTLIAGFDQDVAWARLDGQVTGLAEHLCRCLEPRVLGDRDVVLDGRSIVIEFSDPVFEITAGRPVHPEGPA